MRTILVLTTIVAVICGVWLRQALVQRDVCKQLAELDVYVELAEPPKWLQWLPESMLSYGGGHYFCPVNSVRLQGNDSLRLVCKLPSLTRLEFLSGWVDSRDFGLLARCRNLEQLNIAFCDLSDEDVAKIPRLPRLQELTLEGNRRFTGASVTSNLFPRLRVLDCSGCRINDEGLRAIGGLTELKELTISVGRVTDAGVKGLAPLKKLEEFSCKMAPISGVGIGELRSLRRLRLSYGQADDGGLREISQLPQLILLDLAYCENITDLGISHLANHKVLQSLDLTDCRGVTDAATQYLVKIPMLHNLSLEGTSARSLGELHTCSRLKSLFISSDQIPIDDAFKFAQHSDFAFFVEDPSGRNDERDSNMLGGMCTLTSQMLDAKASIAALETPLDVRLDAMTGVAAKHVEHLSRDVQSLSLARATISEGLFRDSEAWSQLVSLDLSNSSVTNADLEAIGKLAPLCGLSLYDTGIDDQGIEHLEGLVNLQVLYLARTKVTPASLKTVKKLSHLRSLTLPFNLDAASLLELLKACPALAQLNDKNSSLHYLRSSLSLGNLQLKPTELEQLLKQCRVSWLAGESLNDEHCETLGRYHSLHNLDLSKSSVTDVGIAKIASIAELRTLDLRGTRVTAAGIQSLQALKALDELRCDPTEWTNDYIDAILALKSLKTLVLPLSEIPAGPAHRLVTGVLRDGSVDIKEDTSWAHTAYNRGTMAWLVGNQPFDPDTINLALIGSLVDSQKASEIESSPAIDSILVKNVTCSDVLWERIVACKKARYLTLEKMSISPLDLLKLRDMESLYHLSLIDCDLGAEHLAAIGKVVGIEELDIEQDRIDSEAVIELKQSTGLIELSVRTREVDDELRDGMRQLRKYFSANHSVR